MVTGGLRRLDAMEAALESGSADMIGIGRPMCVMTDAPKRLLEGEAELPRYENILSLLPRWAKWLERISLVRTVAGFAPQFWYYQQLVEIGRNGRADDTLTVAKAASRHQASEKRLLAERAGLATR